MNRITTRWCMALGLMLAVPLVLATTCAQQQQANRSPTSNAGPDQTVAAGAAVTLTGAASTDPDGDTLTFTWSSPGGTAVILSSTTAASPTFTAPNAAATLTFTLTVNDGRGGAANDSVVVTVTAANQNPTANAGPDQTVAPAAAVTLTGAASTDPDGDTLTFLWAQTGGTAVTLSSTTAASPTFTAPNAAATLTFTLTVNDGRGGTATDTVVVTVTAANQNPTASAGTDQTVAAGSTVTLNGSASSDPDGDTLTFAWSQTGGTAVTLSSTTAASPTFTAPNAAATLTFTLTVNDGHGGTNTDTVVVTVNLRILLIANFTGNGVLGYNISSPASVNGNLAPNANLSGAQTLLSSPSDIVVDGAGALLASNFAGNSITGYANARNLSGINGNVAPGRNVQGAATLLAGPVSLAISTANDLLFVAPAAGNTIRVYAGASTAGFNGNLPPTRSFTDPALAVIRGINFGASDNLYVANNLGNNVLVYANASTINGAVAATRTIISPAVFANLFDVFVDGSDRMYVVEAAPGNQIHIFNSASTLNGNVAPSVTITVQGALNISAIAVDSTGVGYIIDAFANAMYSYDNIATRNGLLPPDRTLSGANTQMNTPIRVFLVE